MSVSAAPISRGYLVLADISGYTSFLSQTELDHAQEILSDLLETVLQRFQALLTIQKIEGDAVFAYAGEARIVRGETLLELIERTYCDFRDRMKNVRRHTTCTCRACQSIPTLDLKFMVHYGDFAVQHIGGTTELAGSDVNLVHRLLKNHVAESKGWHGYALFSAAALECMRVSAEGLWEGTESYEHLGEIKTYVEDLHARYDEIVSSRRVFLPVEEADRVMEFRFSSPPAVVWEWFNEPARRSRWMQQNIVPIVRVKGRLEPGARNHCVHGKNAVVVEDLLDIRPFDYFTTEQRPQGNPLTVRSTFQFEARPEGGTRVVMTCRTAGAGFPRWATRLVSRYFVERQIRRTWAVDKLDEMIREESPDA